MAKVGKPLMRTANLHSIPEYYRYYKSRKTSNPQKTKVFNEIVRKFNLRVRELIVEKGFEFSTFGVESCIKVIKYKRKIREVKEGYYNLPINTKETMKLRLTKPDAPPIYHLNRHSDGYTCCVKWIRSHNPPELKFYNFIRCARFKKHVADAITLRQAHLNYYESNSVE